MQAQTGIAFAKTSNSGPAPTAKGASSRHRPILAMNNTGGTREPRGWGDWRCGHMVNMRETLQKQHCTSCLDAQRQTPHAFFCNTSLPAWPRSAWVQKMCPCHWITDPRTVDLFPVGFPSIHQAESEAGLAVGSLPRRLVLQALPGRGEPLRNEPSQKRRHLRQDVCGGPGRLPAARDLLEPETMLEAQKARRREKTCPGSPISFWGFKRKGVSHLNQDLGNFIALITAQSQRVLWASDTAASDATSLPGARLVLETT